MAGLISITTEYSGIPKSFERLENVFHSGVFNKYGEIGVNALQKATPVDTGKTAKSWSYKVISNSEGIEIQWNNSNINNGVNIAVILEYGHGTRNGGYVRGRKYLGPALSPVFDDMVEKLKREVEMIGNS